MAAQRSRDRLPNSNEDTAERALSTLTAEQRTGFLRFARSKLPENNPLLSRIDLAIDVLGQAGEHSTDQPMADEIKETEVAAWLAIEAQKETAHLESIQITGEVRCARLEGMQRLVSASPGGPEEWAALEEKFRAAHQHHPDLSAWVHLNEVPLLTGAGSLSFRELAHRAACTLTGDPAADAWKSWLDVLVGYLPENDLGEEYLRVIQIGHREPCQGATSETDRGRVIYGESYRIDHLWKASELCCAWLGRTAGNRPASIGSELGTMSFTENSRASSGSNKDRSASSRTDDAAANSLRVALLRQGLNVPRLASQVRAVLKRRGGTKLKVDRTTIYRLVRGQTKHPDPAIWSAVCEVLKLPRE